LDRLWENKIKEVLVEIVSLYFNGKDSNTLLPEAYTTLGYTLEMISQLDEQTLGQLNNKILNFFKILVCEKHCLQNKIVILLTEEPR